MTRRTHTRIVPRAGASVNFEAHRARSRIPREEINRGLIGMWIGLGFKKISRKGANT